MTFAQFRIPGLIFASMCVFAGARAESSDWYMGVSLGGNWASGADQRGWNGEGTCYPTFACFDQNPVPMVDGYRWSYANDLDAGYAAEITLGRSFNRWRLETALAQRENDIGQERFLGLTHLDGSPVGQSANTVTNQAMTVLGGYRARSISLNAYLDFPGVFAKVTPYLGAGASLAYLRVSNVFYADVYSDTASPPGTYDPPLSFYGSRQDDDLSETITAGHLYAGLDYPLTEHTLVGLKVAWSRFGAMEDEGRYISHPFHLVDPDFSNHNRFDTTSHWSVMVTWKMVFNFSKRSDGGKAPRGAN